MEQLRLSGNWDIRERIIYGKNIFSGEVVFYVFSIMSCSIWGFILHDDFHIRNERTKMKHLFLNNLCSSTIVYFVPIWFYPAWVWFGLVFVINFLALAEVDHGLWFRRTIMCILSWVFITEVWVFFVFVPLLLCHSAACWLAHELSLGGTWA